MSHPTLPISFVALDFETPSRRAADGLFVEVAVALVREGRVVESWATLANPGRPCEPGAEAVHGITAEQLVDAPAIADVLPELLAWLGDGLPVVAYNGDTFDRIVFERACINAGLTPPRLQWVDPLPVARSLLRQKSHKLADVAATLQLAPQGDLHRAAADVELLVRVTIQLGNMLQGQAAPATAPAPSDTELAPFEATSELAPPPPPAPAAVARPALVAEALAALAPLSAKVKAWIAKADALPCSSAAEEGRVIDAIATFRKLDRDAEVARKVFTDEIGKQKRDIEAAWRTGVAKPIEGVLVRLEAARKPLALARAQAAAAEQRRQREEAEVLALAARDEAAAPAVAANDAALEALLSGDTEGALAHAATAAAVIDAANDLADNVHAAVIERSEAVAPAPVRSTMATATDRIVWRVQVLAPELVPAEFCSPDLGKLEQAIAAASGDIVIPGVAFEADVATSTRSRRGA